jgi:xylulokinase
MERYLLGYDIGSSSIKASLIRVVDGEYVSNAVSPEEELGMISHKPGWAEQHPDIWWEHVIKTTRVLLQKTTLKKEDIAAIGISYQMHGLVVVDKDKKPIRPSIIWCDSRAADIGKRAFEEIGKEVCLSRFLNSPGNFTASKLKWVQENETEIYQRIHKIMLPGDYIGMKMTGRICTTVSGLSEAILWDYQQEGIAKTVLEQYKVTEDLIPEAVSGFEVHGHLTAEAAGELGLAKGTAVSYRAGDQPNNAFSLRVLHPGEVAATAGTSGVIYGINDQPAYDEKSRVNTFVHVNHKKDKPRYGVLLCVNGTGILNSWLRKNIGFTKLPDYEEMNRMAGEIDIGADGLRIYPFGNGAERILENRDLGAQISGLHFNRHNERHLFRAGQEGIVYALAYGFHIMQNMGMKMETVKAGYTNMFLSPLFHEAFVNTTNTNLELYNTDGARGAAHGAGVGAGIYNTEDEAFEGLEVLKKIQPDPNIRDQYQTVFSGWLKELGKYVPDADILTEM